MLTPAAMTPLTTGLPPGVDASSLPPGIGDSAADAGGGGGSSGGGGGGGAPDAGSPDAGAPDAAAATDAAAAGDLPAVAAEAKALTGAPGEWYKEPWLWSALSVALGALIIILSARKDKHAKAPAGLGDLREKIHGAKLIMPDLSAGLFYAWKGGNAVCAFDQDGNEVACWPTSPTIQAARDVARARIRASHRPAGTNKGEVT